MDDREQQRKIRHRLAVLQRRAGDRRGLRPHERPVRQPSSRRRHAHLAQDPRQPHTRTHQRQRGLARRRPITSEAHHIDHHEHGGPADITNLASLCRPCHKDVHNHQRAIDTPADGRPRLRPPEPTGTDPPVPALLGD